MGIGFVLLVFAIIGFTCALFLGIVLRYIVSFTVPLDTTGRDRLKKRATWAPLVVVVYVGAIFSIYAVWCESFRGVDPGIGDSWMVPLGNGYSLIMIDSPNNAYIKAPKGKQIHSGLKNLSKSGQFVVGSESTGSIFVLDTMSGDETYYPSEAVTKEALRLIGINDLQFQDIDTFYQHQRWGFLDFLTALLMFSLPFAIFVSLVREWWRVVESQSSK